MIEVAFDRELLREPRDDHHYAIIKQLLAGYIEAMLFTESDDDNELHGLTIYDVCQDSLNEVAPRIEQVYLKFKTHYHRAFAFTEPTYNTLGHDLWYDSNGHGTGAWDRNWYLSDVGDQIADYTTDTIPTCIWYVNDNKITLEL